MLALLGVLRTDVYMRRKSTKNDAQSNRCLRLQCTDKCWSFSVGAGNLIFDVMTHSSTWHVSGVDVDLVVNAAQSGFSLLDSTSSLSVGVLLGECSGYCSCPDILQRLRQPHGATVQSQSTMGFLPGAFIRFLAAVKVTGSTSSTDKESNGHPKCVSCAVLVALKDFGLRVIKILPRGHDWRSVRTRCSSSGGTTPEPIVWR